MLLKKLTEARGVSGDEGAVREILSSHLSHVSQTTDVFGNLICRAGAGRRVMLCAHMDEVGLIISEITGDGFLKFKTVGGIDAGVLPGKRVFVGAGAIVGIIGFRAVHLQKKDERKAKINEAQLYIDIGAADGAAARAAVSIGDYACFEHGYAEFGAGLIKAKALDDRAGCAIVAELMGESYPFELCAVFTAGEEIGARGARAAARRILPDIAIVVEATVCADIYPAPPHKHVTTLGAGPAFTISDSGTAAHSGLLKTALEVADENGIPRQFKRTFKGGTDAGVIARTGRGVATIIISLPCRYLHTPLTVISWDDYNNTRLLLKKLLQRLGEGF